MPDVADPTALEEFFNSIDSVLTFIDRVHAG
jgi:hypothetical protein